MMTIQPDVLAEALQRAERVFLDAFEGAGPLRAGHQAVLRLALRDAIEEAAAVVLAHAVGDGVRAAMDDLIAAWVARQKAD